MDVDEFWDLHERCRFAGGDAEQVAERVAGALATLPTEEILDYYLLQEGLTDEAYDWLLWAAAYLIGGGCSDDGFVYFRSGLVLQGREVFERARADPDSLAGHPLVMAAARDGIPEVLSCEEAGYVAVDAYGRVNGDGDAIWAALKARPDGRPPRLADPAGELFDFDDLDEMRRRLPRLSALFTAE